MNKKILLPIALILSIVFSLYVSTFAFYFLKGNLEMVLHININTIFNAITTEKQVLILFFLIEVALSLLLWMITNKSGNIYKSQTIKLTDKISIPNSVGQGQYGTSWWMSLKELKNIFKPNKIVKKN